MGDVLAKKIDRGHKCMWLICERRPMVEANTMVTNVSHLMGWRPFVVQVL